MAAGFATAAGTEQQDTIPPSPSLSQPAQEELHPIFDRDTPRYDDRNLRPRVAPTDAQVRMATAAVRRAVVMIDVRAILPDHYVTIAKGSGFRMEPDTGELHKTDQGPFFVTCRHTLDDQRAFIAADLQAILARNAGRDLSHAEKDHQEMFERLAVAPYELWVVLDGGRRSVRAAQVLRHPAQADVLVLRVDDVDAPAASGPGLKLRDATADALKQGEPTLTVGAEGIPYAERTVHGQVSHPSRFIGKTNPLLHEFTVTARGRTGMSGSPLVTYGAENPEEYACAGMHIAVSAEKTIAVKSGVEEESLQVLSSIVPAGEIKRLLRHHGIYRPLPKP